MLQRGIQFILLPVITRSLTAEELGALGIATVVAGIVAIFSSLGLNVAVVRLYFEEPQSGSRGEGRNWAGMVVAQLILGVLVGAVVWITGPIWAGLLSKLEWGPTLQTAVIYGVAQSMMLVAISVLRASQRPGRVGVVSLTQFVVGIPVALWGIAAFDVAG